MVDSLNGLANVHVQKPFTIHVGLGGALVLESNRLKSCLQAFMESMKREAKCLISITATLEKNLKHLEGEGVVIQVVSCHSQDLGIGAEVLNKLDHVLSGVLRRMTTLNLMLKLFKAINGGGHDK